MSYCNTYFELDVAYVKIAIWWKENSIWKSMSREWIFTLCCNIKCWEVCTFIFVCKGYNAFFKTKIYNVVQSTKIMEHAILIMYGTWLYHLNFFAYWLFSRLSLVSSLCYFKIIKWGSYVEGSFGSDFLGLLLIWFLGSLAEWHFLYKIKKSSWNQQSRTRSRNHETTCRK